MGTRSISERIHPLPTQPECQPLPVPEQAGERFHSGITPVRQTHLIELAESYNEIAGIPDDLCDSTISPIEIHRRKKGGAILRFLVVYNIFQRHNLSFLSSNFDPDYWLNQKEGKLNENYSITFVNEYQVEH